MERKKYAHAEPIAPPPAITTSNSARIALGSLALCADAQILRIVERRERCASAHSCIAQLDLVAAGVDVLVAAAVRVRHVTERNGCAQSMSVHSRCDEAAPFAVAINGFIVINQGLRVFQQEL